MKPPAFFDALARANVRAARAADGGGVLLVDAGDLFQGTLESNIAEGADVVKARSAVLLSSNSWTQPALR